MPPEAVIDRLRGAAALIFIGKLDVNGDIVVVPQRLHEADFIRRIHIAAGAVTDIEIIILYPAENRHLTASVERQHIAVIFKHHNAFSAYPAAKRDKLRVCGIAALYARGSTLHR